MSHDVVPFSLSTLFRNSTVCSPTARPVHEEDHVVSVIEHLLIYCFTKIRSEDTHKSYVLVLAHLEPVTMSWLRRS